MPGKVGKAVDSFPRVFQLNHGGQSTDCKTLTILWKQLGGCVTNSFCTLQKAFGGFPLSSVIGKGDLGRRHKTSETTYGYVHYLISCKTAQTTFP